MTLNYGTIGENYIVKALHLPEKVKHRLEALGMTQGTQVVILERKDRGTEVLKLRGSRFAVGRGITEGIEVERGG